jgi:hypothetical protein
MRSELGAAINRPLVELIITKLRQERPLLTLMPRSRRRRSVAARRSPRDAVVTPG